MTQTTDLDAPVAWKVTATKPNDKITQHKPAVFESQSASKADAEKYRDELKADGWVATVTPVFLSPQIRGKARVKTQARTAPRGFSEDWRLHPTEGRD